MKNLIALCAAVLLLVFEANAQQSNQSVQQPETKVLRVEAEKTLDLKAEDLAKLQRRELHVKDHDGKETVYSGVDLHDVLKLANARIGGNQLRGKELANFLIVEAADDYKAVFALAELDADFTDKIVLLADKRDNKDLSKNEGHWQIIVPDEKKHGRWVRQVVRLRIAKAN